MRERLHYDKLTCSYGGREVPPSALYWLETKQNQLFNSDSEGLRTKKAEGRRSMSQLKHSGRKGRILPFSNFVLFRLLTVWIMFTHIHIRWRAIYSTPSTNSNANLIQKYP